MVEAQQDGEGQEERTDLCTAAPGSCAKPGRCFSRGQLSVVSATAVPLAQLIQGLVLGRAGTSGSVRSR